MFDFWQFFSNLVNSNYCEGLNKTILNKELCWADFSTFKITNNNICNIDNGIGDEIGDGARNGIRWISKIKIGKNWKSGKAEKRFLWQTIVCIRFANLYQTSIYDFYSKSQTIDEMDSFGTKNLQFFSQLHPKLCEVFHSVLGNCNFHFHTQ